MKLNVLKLTVFVALAMLFLATGCGLSDKVPPSSSLAACIPQPFLRMALPTNNTSNLDAFKKTFLPAVSKAPMNCAKCHSLTGSPSINPIFADSNTDNSFALLIATSTYINWNSPASSHLITMAGNNHCGVSDCSGQGSAMTKAIQDWVAQLSTGSPIPSTSPVPACPPTPKASPKVSSTPTATPSGTPSASPSPSPSASPSTTPVALPTGILLPELPIPTNLPLFSTNPNSFTTLTWNLDALGAGFVGARFSIQVQQYTQSSATNPASYQFAQPRLFVPTASVAIKIRAIDILINGEDPQSETAFNLIDTTVVSEPGAVLLSAFGSGPVIKRMVNDKVSIHLEVLEKVALPNCKNLTVFQTRVLGAAGAANTMTNNCTSCHGTATGAGYAFFQMTGAADALCRRALSRALRASQSQLIYDSPLIKKPVNAAFGHPAVNGFNPVEWANWINSER